MNRFQKGKVMPKLTPEEASKKQVRNLSNSVEDIRRGVNAVTDSPTEKAANAQDNYVAGIQRAVADGKWQRGLRRITLQQWKDAFLNKGLNRIAPGAQAAQGKVEAFYREFFPHIQSAQDEVDRLPKATLEDSITRMTTFIRRMAEFKRQT